MALNYVRDPAAIYAESFASIRRETDLTGFVGDEQDLAIRLVHTCGMPDLVDDLVISPDAIKIGRTALLGGAPIICDVRMVAEGVIARNLPAQNPVLCGLNAPEALAYAKQHETTRSAGGIEAMADQIGGAVIAIGNAPTALFHLLERLDEGLPKPAIILGFPVGFVGAAESKQELIDHARGVPFVALRGRRGGSALAAAAVNAVAKGLDT